MSIEVYVPRSEYVGAGNLNQYSFDFVLKQLSHLLVVVTDIAYVPVYIVRGTDTTFLTSVQYNTMQPGGIVTLVSNLPTGYHLALLNANDAPLQLSKFRGKGDFTLKDFENALDYLCLAIQRNSYLNSRSLKLSDTIPDSVNLDTNVPPPVADSIIGFDPVNTKLIWIPRSTFKGDIGVTGPQGPSGTMTIGSVTTVPTTTPASITNIGSPQASILNFVIPKGENGDAVTAIYTQSGVPSNGLGVNGEIYINTLVGAGRGDLYRKESGVWVLKANILGPPGGVTDIDGMIGSYLTAYNGFSQLTGAQFTSTTLKDTLDKIIRITYTPPTISLAGSSNVLREKGDPISNITLTATVVKKSDPIAAVRFYQGATLLGTKTGTIPGGGNETQAYAPAFSDNTAFSAQVDDNGATGGPTTVTANTNYTFVYPYYSDAGAAGKTAAQVGALTKSIIVSTATVTKTMTATAGQVFYFAYPASYGPLTSILDVNNFETIGDWTLTTANITGLDGNAVSYRIYAFNNPVTAGAYQYTFKR